MSHDGPTPIRRIAVPTECRFKVVAIGASAGGLHSITEVLSTLPGEFPLAIMFVQHMHPQNPNLMPQLVRTHTAMRMRVPITGDPVSPGSVYCATPDRHLLVQHGHIQLTRSAPVHFSRPSVDLMFQSVAESYGAGAIAVVLSGSLSDGAVGVRSIKEAGGVSIVEDPAEAEFPQMATAAIRTGCVDHVLRLREIGPKLIELAALPHSA